MNIDVRNRPLIGAACFALLLGSASAQFAGRTFDPTKVCTVKGVVVNSVTGEAIPRAMVVIEGSQTASMLTDSDGHFSFDLPDGYVLPRARKPGYLAHDARRRSGAMHSTCDGNQYSLRLEPMGVIRGKVTLDDGDPVERTMVSVGRFVIESGRRRFVQLQTAQTNEDGEYRLHDLAAGKYYLSVGPSAVEVIDTSRTAIPKTYFPGVADRNAAALLSLSPGQQLDANFSLKRVRAFRVSGRIVGVAPTQRGGIELLDLSGSEVNAPVRMREGGGFEIIDIPAGSYTLRAMMFEQNNISVGVVHLVVSHDISDVQIPVAAQTPIPVEFHEDTQPSDDNTPYRMRISAPAGVTYPAANLQLVPFDSAGRGSYAGLEKTPGNDGWYLKNVQPGKYIAQATTMGNTYVESIRWGALNLLAEPLTVTASGSADPIEITLKNDGATLTGTVSGDAENPAVLAFASGRLLPFTTGAFANADSTRFTFQRLPPGEYTVYAFDSTEDLEYTNPKVLEKYSSKAARVTLSPKQKSDIQLTLIEVER